MTTRFAALSAIQIAPERIRVTFDQGKLQELADSIASKGLMHAPVCRIVGENLELVAGERRLRAITDIYALGGTIRYNGEAIVEGFVPYVLLGDLDALSAKEAELEENVRRVNLTWQEHAAATAELAALRGEQASIAGQPAPSIADLAEEARGSRSGSVQDTTRKEILLAKHLADPDVQAAKSVDEAFKVLKRKEQARQHTELAERIGKTFSAADHQLIQGDCLEWLRKAGSEQFTVILTDPPYGMGADEFGDSGGKTGGGHSYVDSAENFLTLFEELPTQLFRVAQPQAHLYLFCDVDWFTWLREQFARAGWRVFRTPLIWFKPAAYRAPWPEHGPQRKYETLLYALKGDKPVTKLAGDVLQYPPDENLGHQAQKPIALLDDLLRRSVRPGDSVLDPFCGSGGVFPAAHALKCRATGVELDPVFYGIALRRLEALK